MEKSLAKLSWTNISEGSLGKDLGELLEILSWKTLLGNSLQNGRGNLLRNSFEELSRTTLLENVLGEVSWKALSGKSLGESLGCLSWNGILESSFGRLS